MAEFKTTASYVPTGDQPTAVATLAEGLEAGDRMQTLVGATGTGKTATMAWTIEKVGRPALVIAHNKTFAAQLCNEFREFFPENAVEYFVSYYDYYQPEAYIAKSDTYIEKEAMINEEIDRLRHSATQALLTRKDVIIRASVIQRLIDMQFKRMPQELVRGSFRVRGGILELMPVNEEAAYRIEAPKG